MEQPTLKSIIAGLALWVLPATLQAQATSACRPADSTSVRMVKWLSNVVTGTDAGSTKQRDQMKLPVVDVSQITYVTDSKVCSKVVTPYNAKTVMGSVTPSGKLYVVKVGSVYVAKDPVKAAGEFDVYVTVDSRYRVLASSLG
jgi:hypothetical protein